MPLILYIDTSAKHATYLLMDDSKILASRSHSVQNEHGQTINTLIQDLLTSANLNFSDLNAVAVLNGPGSYTGLRISLATAKGICFAMGIPLLLMNKLDVLAQHALEGDSNICALMTAREGEYYAAFYDENGNPMVQPSLMMHAEVISNLEKLHAEIISDEVNISHDFARASLLDLKSEMLQKIVLNAFHTNKETNLIESEPFYLKNVHINKINKL